MRVGRLGDPVHEVEGKEGKYETVCVCVCGGEVERWGEGKNIVI